MKIKALVAAATLCVAGGANAMLAGETLNYQYYFPNTGSAYGGAQNGPFVVGAGAEIVQNMVDGHGNLDVSDTQIHVLFTRDVQFSPGAFNGFILSDSLSSIDAFSSVTINAGTTLSGFGAGNLSFDADSISVHWESLAFSAGQQLILDVNVVAVPEPETYAMMLAGLGALAYVARRRKAA